MEKEVIKEILSQYDREMQTDKRAAAIRNKIGKGKGTYADASEYASRAGLKMGRKIAETLSNEAADGMVDTDLAREVLSPTIRHNYKAVMDVTTELQASLNRSAGLGLMPVVPELDTDRVEGLIREVSGDDHFSSLAPRLVQQIENLSMAAVDDSVQANADFHYEAGLVPVIHRIAESGCCKWCEELAGTYEYSKVNNTGNDVFRRHDNCRCQVIFDPRKSGRRSQNAHSKKILSAREAEELEARKTAGLPRRTKTPQERNLEAAFTNQAVERSSDQLVNAIIDNHEALKYYKPEDMYRLLQQSGYSVTPLNLGVLKDKTFADGGGFRIHFGNDGYFQYHPKEGSHHGGAYWKVSNGKIGKRRYNLDGIPKEN